MSTNVEAATPRIMISDYEVSGNKVVSGENFDFKLTLKNESANPVKNIKVTVSTENGELLPRKGAGTAYVKEITGGKEEEVSFADWFDYDSAFNIITYDEDRNVLKRAYNYIRENNL